MLSVRACFFLVLFVVAIGISSSAVCAGNLRGHVWMNTFDFQSKKATNNSIIQFDPISGKISNIRVFSQSLWATEGTFDPIRQIYYLLVGTGSVYQLFGFDARNGSEGTILFRTDLPQFKSLMSLQCDWKTGDIIAVHMTDNSASIVKIEPQTGYFEKVVDLPNYIGVLLQSEAFDNDRRIYLKTITEYYQGNRTDFIYKVDIPNKNITKVALTQTFTSLVWDSKNRRLLGNGNGGYFQIDLNTGAFKVVIQSLTGIPDTITIDSENQILYAAVDYFGANSMVVFDLNNERILGKYPIDWDVRFGAFFP